MATYSSILAWRIPWTEEPGGLQFMGSQRIGHDRVTKHAQHSCPSNRCPICGHPSSAVYNLKVKTEGLKKIKTK